MSNNSSIEWTDATWQTVAGCTRVSPGCQHCYAEVMSGRLAAMAQTDLDAGRNPGKKRVHLQVVNQRAGVGVNGYGPKSGWNRRVVTLPENLEEPLRWKKPRRIFVNSMSDLFHADVPFEFIDRVFAVMALCPQHTFQVLTKRPERMAEYLAVSSPEASDVLCVMDRMLQEGHGVPAAVLSRLGAVWFEGERDYSDSMHRYAVPPGYEFNNFAWPLPNVWLGTSCEDQQRADERIPHLLRCPATVRFLSAEPLLGPIDLGRFLCCPWCKDAEPLRDGSGTPYHVNDGVPMRCPTTSRGLAVRNIHQVIAGGESGPGARECKTDWIRSIVRQCAAANVPCFTKQMGSVWAGDICINGKSVRAHGDPKGGDPQWWDSDLRVRQMPEGVTL